MNKLLTAENTRMQTEKRANQYSSVVQCEVRVLFPGPEILHWTAERGHIMHQHISDSCVLFTHYIMGWRRQCCDEAYCQNAFKWPGCVCVFNDSMSDDGPSTSSRATGGLIWRCVQVLWTCSVQPGQEGGDRMNLFPHIFSLITILFPVSGTWKTWRTSTVLQVGAKIGT